MSILSRSSVVRSARFSVSIIFLVKGMVFASWVALIPFVQDRLALSEGLLGLALLAVALGAIPAMALSGWLVSRAGSRCITVITTVAFCLTLLLPIIAPSFPALVIALFFFGACGGSMDVAMNAQAVSIEEARGEPTMSSIHGLFSLGGLVGAGLGAIAFSWGLTPESFVSLIVACSTAMSLGAFQNLRDGHSDSRKAEPTFVLPTGPLLGLGSLAFLVLLAEGGMADWSGVYLSNVLAAPPGLAASGYTAFSLTMAIGRLSGDRLTAAFGPVVLVRFSALVAAASLTAALLVTHPVVATLCFGGLGLGLSNLTPLFYSAAGRTPGMEASTSLAAVATFGQFGLLAGPALIGFTAELTSLPIALGLIVVAVSIVAFFARLAHRAVNVEVASSEGAQVGPTA